jgi:hypothetical protein|tara:strand:+ start:605 stop:883 length:279 start_codon:yes stop_codon:yes gene_type:complete
MIESLLILFIGFGFLFYFIQKVDKKIETMNEYRIRVFEDKYHVLLKNNEDYYTQLRVMEKHIRKLEALIRTSKQKESKNIYTLKTKNDGENK